MRRRQFLIVGALGAITSGGAIAQARPVRVGLLTARPLAESLYTGPIVRRLADLGYREGAGMVLEYRATRGFADRYPKMARELIDLKCDLIFAVGPEVAVSVFRDARTSIPVVFLAVDFDPLETGIVKSLSRPEANITGVYIPQGELAAKRLDIMREVLPSARRFLVFSDEFARVQLAPLRRRAEASGMKLIVIEFSKQPYDFAGAFDTGRKEGAEALIGLASAVFAANLATVTALAAQHRLPSAGTSGAMADGGFMLSYGPDVSKITRRVAELGVRILKGAKPADIPVEQADEFVLVVNAKIAKALGVKIPESVMARATRIIT
jgi:putative tryptophan/tyrosine transport system substrate-binding protein